MNESLPQLGGLSAQQFLRRHWQRRPVLMRGAALGAAGRISRQELFALARLPGVESRLVRGAEGRWTLRHGPFARLPALSEPQWTLLVQGCEAHLPVARALMDAYRFLPDARLDDVMSTASTMAASTRMSTPTTSSSCRWRGGGAGGFRTSAIWA